jgi:O-antigen biosynthesis protein
MDLSVIIVSYNVRYFLELCLVSVRKAAKHIDCEVFVVDNNSTDDSCSMVRRQFPEVNLITNTDNRGFATANNQAIKLATGRYILLLNPDTILEEDIFGKCIGFMIENPDAGAIGVRMINGNGKFLRESKRALPTPGTAFFKMSGLSNFFPRSVVISRYHLGNLDSMKTTQADIISGAFMFLLHEAVIKTGLLDETFFMYGEDIDYSYRLLKAGFKNYYFPEARIIHFKGESTKKGKVSVSLNFHKAMSIFVRKHINNGKSRVLNIPVQLSIFVMAGLSILKQVLVLLFQPLKDILFPKSGKTVVVSDPEGFQRITKLLEPTGKSTKIVGRISINPEAHNEKVLGNIKQIRDVLVTHNIREVIFASGQINASQIIDSMHLISDQNVSARLASENERFIIGSGFVKYNSDCS